MVAQLGSRRGRPAHLVPLPSTPEPELRVLGKVDAPGELWRANDDDIESFKPRKHTGRLEKQATHDLGFIASMLDVMHIGEYEQPITERVRMLIIQCRHAERQEHDVALKLVESRMECAKLRKSAQGDFEY